MSVRKIPTEATMMQDTLRDFEQRLRRLENGGATAGQLSLGPSLIIGNLQIDAIEEGADTLNVKMTNLLTGSSYTIPITAA